MGDDYDNFEDFRTYSKIIMCVIFVAFILHMLLFLYDLSQYAKRMKNKTSNTPLTNPFTKCEKVERVLRVIVRNLEIEIVPSLILFISGIATGSFIIANAIFGIIVGFGFVLTFFGAILKEKRLTIMGRVGIAIGTVLPFAISLYQYKWAYQTG